VSLAAFLHGDNSIHNLIGDLFLQGAKRFVDCDAWPSLRGGNGCSTGLVLDIRAMLVVGGVANSVSIIFASVGVLYFFDITASFSTVVILDVASGRRILGRRVGGILKVGIRWSCSRIIR